MTRMTGPDCAVMCNLTNTHTHTHTHGGWENKRRADDQEGHHGTHLHTCMPRCYAGFGPFGVRTGFFDS